MKVILLDDVKNYGKKDQVIEVSNGFAKNHLIPNKLAIIATKDSISHLNVRKKIESENIQKEKNILNEVVNKIESITLEFKLKFNNDKPQGSISLAHICDLLEKTHKIKIDKRKFIKHENIKDRGLHYLKIKLDKNLIATLKVLIQDL